jgi:hypothetical protein
MPNISSMSSSGHCARSLVIYYNVILICCTHANILSVVCPQDIPLAVMGGAMQGAPMPLKALTPTDVAPGCPQDLFEGLQRLLSGCTHQHPECRPPAKEVWDQLQQCVPSAPTSCDVPVAEETAATAAWEAVGGFAGQAAWGSATDSAASGGAMSAPGQESCSSSMAGDVAPFSDTLSDTLLDTLPDSRVTWGSTSDKKRDLNLVKVSSTCMSPFVAQWATAD